MIYFVRCGHDGPIKIGHTTSDLASRISFLQVGCPWPLTVMGTMEGDAQAEAALLKSFAHVNMRGEWFHSTPELLAFINETATRTDEKPRKVVVPIFAPAGAESDEDWPAIITEILYLNRWNQGDLAFALGRGQPMVSKWRGGKHGPGKSSRILLRSILADARKRAKEAA